LLIEKVGCHRSLLPIIKLKKKEKKKEEAMVMGSNATFNDIYVGNKGNRFP
jgi:hypothetical protein